MSLPTIDGVQARTDPPSEMVRRFGDQFAELERAKEVLASCRAQNENLVAQNVKLTGRLEALAAALRVCLADCGCDDHMCAACVTAREAMGGTP